MLISTDFIAQSKVVAKRKENNLFMIKVPDNGGDGFVAVFLIYLFILQDM